VVSIQCQLICMSSEKTSRLILFSETIVVFHEAIRNTQIHLVSKMQRFSALDKVVRIDTSVLKLRDLARAKLTQPVTLQTFFLIRRLENQLGRRLRRASSSWFSSVRPDRCRDNVLN
jgi:hypothetical protein